MLVVVSGLPGTGESTVADALAARLGAMRVSVDVVEDALLSSGLTASWKTGVAAYRAAAEVAGLTLARGLDVVADAVNDSEAARDTWREAASGAGADLRFVVLALEDADEHRRRAEQRSSAFQHVRVPTWGEVRDRAASSEPWAGEDHLQIDAGIPVDEVVVQVLAQLRAG